LTIPSEGYYEVEVGMVATVSVYEIRNLKIGMLRNKHKFEKQILTWNINKYAGTWALHTQFGDSTYIMPSIAVDSTSITLTLPDYIAKNNFSTCSVGDESYGLNNSQRAVAFFQEAAYDTQAAYNYRAFISNVTNTSIKIKFFNMATGALIDPTTMTNTNALDIMFVFN
jgi:hypothetical protein